MTNLAGEWYANGLLWTVVGIGVTLAVGLLAAWATIVSANPKLTLGYRLKANTRLVSDPNGLLSVRYNGRTISDPHIAEILIVNHGRKDIVGDMFHNGTQLSVDLGRHILALLDATSEPPSVAPPAATVAGRMLHIPPAHVMRKQRITYAVLVDGPASEPQVTHSLVNVTVRQTAEAPALILAAYRAAAVSATSAAAVITVLGYLFST